MLEQVLTHIHNRFETSRLEGTFTVSSGTMELDGVLDGQYLWIEGSVLNDGLHRYPLSGLDDETFDGRVVLLAVPKAVQDLAEEISDWCDNNKDSLDSPYQSESFGGYSYTRAGAPSSDGYGLSGWRLQFRDRLNPWRKMGFERW